MTLTNNILAAACEPWSTVPIICLVVGLVSLIGIYFVVKFLKNKKLDKWLNLMILAYGLIFLGLEIYHEVSRYFEFGYYDWSSFPFQFCSIPIYLCLILPFIKNEKIREPFFYYIGIFCMISGAFPLLFGQDSLCRWPDVWEVVRSFVWHFLMLHIVMIAYAYRPIAFDLKKTWKPFVGCLCVFVGITVVAQLLNVILHYTGGINFPNTSGGPIKVRDETQFYDPDQAGLLYISPFLVSTMPVFNTIYLKAGWFVNYLLYILSFSFGATLVFFVTFGIKQLIQFLKNKKNKHASE